MVVKIMSLKPFIYFYDCIPNADASLVIHIIQCSQLSHEPDRGYLGMAASPSRALCRAKKTFPEKSFVLCPYCCNEGAFDTNNK